MSTNENNGISAVTTGQAPQAQSPQSTQAAVNALSQSNSGGDSLICQWQNCGERTTTPEALYVSVDITSNIPQKSSFSQDREAAKSRPSLSSCIIYSTHLSLSSHTSLLYAHDEIFGCCVLIRASRCSNPIIILIFFQYTRERYKV
jgi:hypothetical protein